MSDTDDIIAKLRAAQARGWSNRDDPRPGDAAGELERLRAEVEALRSVVREVAHVELEVTTGRRLPIWWLENGTDLIPELSEGQVGAVRRALGEDA